jgi:hypothetical protein
MKSKDEATLSTLRTLIDATEGIAARLNQTEHAAFAEQLASELEERRRELAESFELAHQL